MSPARGGWVSLYSQGNDLSEWLPALCETLECPGIAFEVGETDGWTAVFYRDGRLIGRYDLPTADAEWAVLTAVADDLGYLAPGQSFEYIDPDDPVLREAARSVEYASALEELQSGRPLPEALRPFLPEHRQPGRAWELLTAIDRPDDEQDDVAFVEDFIELFAGYLDIQDATWDPQEDAEAFADGDYDDEEMLPSGWKDFLVLPLSQLNVL